MPPCSKPITLALLLAAAIAAPALAQQPSSSYPPGCDASKVSRADVDRAHTVFLSGKQFLEESNYEKAISYFKDAYSIDCSIHAILPIIATANERKGDRGEAVRALEEYQKRAPAAPDHEVIERRIHNLKDQLARDTAATASAAPVPVPSVSSSTAPTASSAPAPTAPAPIAPPPSASAGAPPAPEGSHDLAPWIVAGAGGVAAVAGVIVYVIGSGDVSTAEKNCPNHKCPTGDSTDISQGNDGRTLENAGGVLIGVGAAAAVAGIVWHFLEPAPGAPGPAAAGATRVVPVLRSAAGGAGAFTGVSVSGSF